MGASQRVACVAGNHGRSGDHATAWQAPGSVTLEFLPCVNTYTNTVEIWAGSHGYGLTLDGVERHVTGGDDVGRG